MENQGLYDERFEHDACGVGLIANIKGKKSHQIVTKGLEILKNLTHRGAVGADPLQGDGAGILIQIPDTLYRDDMLRQGVTLPPIGEYGVGMVFLPQEEASRHACQEEIERAVLAEGQVILGWRDVPVNASMPMSPVVREKEPVIRQIFVGPSRDVLVTDVLERKLYVIRKRCSIAIANLELHHCNEFYIPSFSARTVVYKGQLLASQVGEYYKDLTDSRCTSALAMIHQRFSTNTFPQWSLAHPFRMIAHNGEINTLRGNFNWVMAREKHISSPIFGDDLEKLWPLIFNGQSDSASFDNALELLTMGGYSLAQAAMMMIPEAWENNPHMDPALRSFYEYHAAMMEPWDGPAAVVFTDGRQVGATLDRNGLRPARYLITKHDEVVLASEEGVLPIEEADVVRHWRLEPGKMLLIDLEQGRIIDNGEIKNSLARARPYQEWVNKIRMRLEDLPQATSLPSYALDLEHMLRVFGYSTEDVERLVKVMATQGQEPVLSMGNDTPLAVLSKRPHLLYDYFRQLFAQVTNPPIDPIREQMVTSLVSFIGPRPDLLDIMAVNPPVRLEVLHPVLSRQEMEKLRQIESNTSQKFIPCEIDITYPLSWGADGIEARLASIKAKAIDAVKSGSNVLILSDRLVAADRVAIPALLATSAVHQVLVEQGLRTGTGLVVETGSARTVHHFALLGAYGAEAVCPYLALDLVRSLANAQYSADVLEDNYIHAVCKGLNKIMAKMGICTYMSYIGAQIFESVGLSSEFVDKYFTNTPASIEGVDLFTISQEAVAIHHQAFRPVQSTGGALNWREGEEEHMWTPEAVVQLQHAVRNNDPKAYEAYAQIINDHNTRLMTIRGMFDFKSDRAPVPLEQVESAEEIMRRFSTAAMSMGSISAEAHCTMAIAMNRIGAMSNSGEGGEDEKRYLDIDHDTTLKEILGDDVIVSDIPVQKGDSLRSRTKQVASGRFGVTATYLNHADLIQIKVAQGAKPGEGGQLPGHKVSGYIGKLRHSLPGIGLISPPPHHDIYSIEDLAQLIYDLKLANDKANISVKLVSEVGIGTVAAGVAKCKADHIVVSGHDGGTGAAPASSIHHTGSAWEIGLADVQQTLVRNQLRNRVRLQVDGQIKTGRDVVIGALLGADEFGFGTAPLVTLGCLIMRKCHKNTCPAGIATQDPELRKHFAGRPEHVINYFRFVAEEVRTIMAQLGFTKLSDMIGHAEILTRRNVEAFKKAESLSLTKIVFKATENQADLSNTSKQDHEVEQAFDQRVLPQVQSFLEQRQGKGKKGKQDSLVLDLPVKNINRSVGTLLSSYLDRVQAGLNDDAVVLKLNGTAGQSFGAFVTKGLTLDLTGGANDYVGKGLSGGVIAVHKAPAFEGLSFENIIAGNACFYGATTGKAFLSGVVGERFGVRNSGADLVCEGCGDHGCEYMTGGTAVVLGKTGRNFAAGMSGGVAYVYDPNGSFSQCLAQGDFIIERMDQPLTKGGLHKGKQADELLKELITEHYERTGSQRAKDILDNFEKALGQFVRICPQGYHKVLLSLPA